jgi:hypothetical protein
MKDELDAVNFLGLDALEIMLSLTDAELRTVVQMRPLGLTVTELSHWYDMASRAIIVGRGVPPEISGLDRRRDTWGEGAAVDNGRNV